MNLEGIFNLFSFHDDDGEQRKIEQEIESYITSPHYVCKMFIKLINNGDNFQTQLLYFFQTSLDSPDIDDLKEAGKFMMHSRAWYWISQCDLNKDEWKECLKNIPHKTFFKCLDICIEYYISFEEYEKCAFLQSIKDFCKNT